MRSQLSSKFLLLSGNFFWLKFQGGVDNDRVGKEYGAMGSMAQDKTNIEVIILVKYFIPCL